MDRTDQDRAAPESRVGQRIRATNPNGYRSTWDDPWGTVATVVEARGRLCYLVSFADEKTDLWVVNDPSDPYEFA